MYLLKLALRPWRRATLSQLFSSVAVGFLLLLAGFLFWIEDGLRPVLVRLQGEQVMTAYLSPSVEINDEKTWIERVRSTLKLAPSVDVKVVSAPQFLNLLKKQYPDLVREVEGLGKEMHPVVPRYISISGMVNDAALEKLKNLPGVESAESSKHRYKNAVAAFSMVRWVMKVLLLGVCLALLAGLIQLSRMNHYLHQDALLLLKFWGAGKGTLTAPGMISGLMVGLLGGLIAWGGWMTAGVELARHVRSLSQFLKGMPLLNMKLAMVLLLMGGGIGLLSGLLGSLFNPSNAESGSGS